MPYSAVELASNKELQNEVAKLLLSECTQQDEISRLLAVVGAKQAAHPAAGEAYAAAAAQGGESSDDSSGYESDPEREVELMRALEEKVEIYSRELGLDAEKTLRKIFRLLNLYIQHYKLDVMDALLERVEQVCRARGKGSVWYIKYIQMLGFCRWKQYRLREALALFLEQEGLIGDNSILCENIGHTYSSLGDYEKAREYFTKGLALLGADGAPGRQAGFYYGLGLATDRLGSTRDALPLLHKALEGYRADRVDPQGLPVDSSIHAKVESSIGHMHEKLGDYEEAITWLTEALRVFRKTVGNESPLTATAVGSLGKLYLERGNVDAAQPLLKEALEGEVNKDAFQVDDTFTMINHIKNLHTSVPNTTLASLHKAYAQYVGLLQKAVDRAAPLLKTPKKGDVAALYKTCGEVFLLAGENQIAIKVLTEAVAGFKETTQIDCSGLIDGCNQLLQIGMQMAQKEKENQGGRGSGAPPTNPH